MPKFVGRVMTRSDWRCGMQFLLLLPELPHARTLSSPGAGIGDRRLIAGQRFRSRLVSAADAAWRLFELGRRWGSHGIAHPPARVVIRTALEGNSTCVRDN